MNITGPQKSYEQLWILQNLRLFSKHETIKTNEAIISCELLVNLVKKCQMSEKMQWAKFEFYHASHEET